MVILPNTRDSRQAINECVHRTANERRPPAATMKCECECHRVECDRNFLIDLAHYEAVRRVGHRFLVVPGHESPNELVVAATIAYVVVDKLGAQAAIADALDPRNTRT